ncbi:MAG: hypothetical protein LBU83_01945 [Bacteroidales bacterium]|jgi:hypothetical protein|nr:hypothetical protein [Bacteroidales bacterium]
MVLSLAVGMQDKTDSTLLFVAQAADIRADNLDIVCEFVLEGKQLAYGTAKKGYCAIINNFITIGAGAQTPLLQKAIESGGYFFRQYALVDNGEFVSNKPKNKFIRRAIAVKNEQVIMVQSIGIESFHDFTQALIDFGVRDAIYLVGSNAYGWYYDREKQKHEFGKERENLPANVSYIVWRAKLKR